MDEQKIADLPLNGRNYVDLMMLQTGISQATNKTTTGGQVGTWFSSNGAPVRSNNFLLDGASLANMFGASSGSATGSTLGLDGIQEWRTVTNSFSAEYGMTMGSQMLIASKGGTNVFHGAAFEYLRNNVLDAANFFDNPSAANGFKRCLLISGMTLEPLSEAPSGKTKRFSMRFMKDCGKGRESRQSTPCFRWRATTLSQWRQLYDWSGRRDGWDCAAADLTTATVIPAVI